MNNTKKKEPGPIEVTDNGIAICSNDEKLENPSFSTDFTDDGIAICFIDKQSLNKLLLITSIFNNK